MLSLSQLAVIYLRCTVRLSFGLVFVFSNLVSV